jgi:hypothetical protein
MATQSRSGPSGVSGTTPTDIIRALKLEVSAQKLLVVQERAAAEIAKTEAEAAKAEAEAAKASAAAAIEQSRTEQRQVKEYIREVVHQELLRRGINDDAEKLV